MAQDESKSQDGGIEVRAFRGYVPPADTMSAVQCPPYDVVDSEESLAIVNGIADAKAASQCFLHVNKPEIDVPDCINNIYDEKVYAKGKENLETFIKDGTLVQSEKAELYVYGQEWIGNKQYGLMCEVSSLQYGAGLIKKHELTRAKKEADRTKLTKIQSANVGPVFLCYRKNEEINNIVKNGDNAIINATKPYSQWHTSISNKFLVCTDDEYNKMDDAAKKDVVTHKLWRVSDENVINKLSGLFLKQVSALYVADGHHRTKAAYNVYEDALKQANNKADDVADHFKYFMAVLFPSSELNILDYNRVVRFGTGNLEKMTNADFLKALTDSPVWTYEFVGDVSKLPEAKMNEFRMYLGGNDDSKGWYKLNVDASIIEKVKGDPVKSLDTSLLSDYLLSPILNIENIRKSEDISFVGGIHGLEGLTKKMDSFAKNNGVAFALRATTIDQLLSVADANAILPPKSTWFEPKLRSGVVVRKW